VKINLECVPCYVNQGLDASEYAEMTEKERWKTIRTVCKELSNSNEKTPAAKIGQKIHKIVRDNSETGDPYRKKKELSNKKAKEYFEDFLNKVNRSENPVNDAAKLATAGNIVDFGPRGGFDIKATLEDGLAEDFAINHWKSFAERLNNAKKLLYFADNSGEIIYDELFLKTLLRETPVEEIMLVVKGGPFLNDVTLEDARNLSLDEIDGVELRTVDNGDGGKSPELWSAEVEDWIDRYDLTVSKGQANYEGLNEYVRPDLFFLLVVKCQLLERNIGAEVGNMVLMKADKQGNF